LKVIQDTQDKLKKPSSARMCAYWISYPDFKVQLYVPCHTDGSI